mmetsp:Transcript_123449/g.308491  ORF Transcript_123449/g.308491 Transcript_123449/m.308491 type:complete len:296 (+) Transcript_123449:119-1006(+)
MASNISPSPGNGTPSLGIASHESRNLQRSIREERAERARIVDDIWQEIENFKGQFRNEMKTLAEHLAASRSAGGAGVVSPQASPSEVDSLRSEVAALRDEVGKHSEGLQALRALIDKGTPNADVADPRGSGVSSVWGKLFPSRAEEQTGAEEQTRAEEQTTSSAPPKHDSDAWASILALRAKVEEMERMCKNYAAAAPRSPAASSSADAPLNSSLLPSTERLDSLETKVGDHGKKLSTLRTDVSKINTEMAFHALGARKFAINVVDMTNRQRRNLLADLDTKDEQLKLAAGRTDQ